MDLKFGKIRWKNLLSTGNSWIEFDLNKHLSALIVGKNGHGKSQLIDALFFALFGRAFRNIKKAALINSRNGKGLEVEVEFSAGPNQYKIHRGIKPNIFNIFCNGKLVNQDASIRDYQQLLEDTVLHMNHHSASQIVILGSAKYVPFMQLKPADRRSVIEDILDIKVFTLMNGALKDRISKLKVDYENNQSEIQRQLQNKLLLEQILTNEKKNRQDEINARQDVIAKSQAIFDQNVSYVSLKEQQKTTLEAKINDHSQIQERLVDLKKYGFAFEDKIKKIKDDLWFFEENDNCPTCLQDIESDHKTHVLDEKNKKVLEFEEGLSKLTEEIDKSNTRYQEIITTQREIITLGNDISRLLGENRSIASHIGKIKTEIVELENKKNETTDTEKKLNDVVKDIDVLNKKKALYLYQAQLYDTTGTLLKDGGIKAQIIKQYLPIINKAINKYLQNLGFAHSFELDEEFNETIKSHFIDEFSYENFSEGEKQRIDLALLLAWRHVAKVKGSIKTNLLIMDETFDSSMDQAGVEDLMNLFMSNFGKDMNLFVISHRGDAMIEKFEKVFRLEKVKGYSIVKEEK